MALFGKKEGGLMDAIRCDEPEYLIWKWRPAGADANDTKKENAIRWGSSLRVKDGEVAVFVYKQKDGAHQDFIEGPFDEAIKTANFPILASIVGAAFGGGTPFQAEVYFINLAGIIQVKFGVPYFDVWEPLKTSVFRGICAMLHCKPLQLKRIQCNSAASLKTNRVFRDARVRPALSRLRRPGGGARYHQFQTR